MTRLGPRPLSVHIGMAASSFPTGGQNAFSQAMQEMLLGIRQYQLHPHPPSKLPLNTLWRAGEVEIKGTGKALGKTDKPVLLLTPSLINRAYILDLMKERSLLRWMEGQGIKTYLLDWGEPTKDKDMKDVSAAIGERLVPAIEMLAKKTGAPIHVLGYCMGGTFLAGAASFAQRSIKSLIFLAAPWDFHAGSQALLNRVKFWSPMAAPMIEERGYLPVDWMQTVFASLDPESTAKKFAHFAALDPESENAKIFVAVEDWLNDGVDLPAKLAQEPIDDWFMKNLPAKGKWKVGGKFIKPAKIDLPALVIASKKDRLVEYETAAALKAQMRHAKILNPGCGHIGMMAGKDAVEKVWAPISKWIRKSPP